RVSASLPLSAVSCQCGGRDRDLHSSPTRRSSDLRGRPCTWLARCSPAPEAPGEHVQCPWVRATGAGRAVRRLHHGPGGAAGADRDRKSTRLNSSHVKSSYAVFCLKKKDLDHASAA